MRTSRKTDFRSRDIAKNNFSRIRASDRVRKKFGNYAALLSLIMRQERSIMRQIMRFHFS